MAFVNRAFGAELFAGGINVLLWLSHIVMLALYAEAFGSYRGLGDLPRRGGPPGKGAAMAASAADNRPDTHNMVVIHKIFRQG